MRHASKVHPKAEDAFLPFRSLTGPLRVLSLLGGFPVAPSGPEALSWKYLRKLRLWSRALVFFWGVAVP